MQRHAQQAFFAAESNRLGQVKDAELFNLAVVVNESCDVSALLRDED